MGFQKTQLIPVPSLKHNVLIDDMEKTTAPQANGVFPLKNGPLTILT